MKLITLYTDKHMFLTFFFYFVDGEEPRRKRKSRWAAEDEKVTIPGMPTALPTNMSAEQEEMFLRKNVLLLDTTQEQTTDCRICM